MLETMGSPTRRYGLFIEPPSITPADYRLFDKFPGLEKDFDAIFTADKEMLDRLPNAQKIEIVQTYLTAAEGEERRVRQRGADGHYTYYETIKRSLSGVRRLEKERRLSKDEYLTLLMESDSSAHPIRKTRYCLTYANQYFEIDLYPFWKDQAILEIELKDENDEISIPEEIEIIREVTDDPAYKNAALAHT